jgi:hypothetical protein
MLRGKFLVVLVLFMVPLLTAGRTVDGQAYNTQTITTEVTNPEATTMTVGTSVETSTALQAHVIFSSPFTLPPTHGVCGIYFDEPFNASVEEIISGTLTVSSKVDFYIMTAAAYQAWSHQFVAGGNCTPGKLVLGQKGTLSYNFTTTIPMSGLYEIVVDNLSTSTVNGRLTADLTANSLTMTTTVVYSTLTQPIVQTLTLITMGTVQGTPVDTSTPLIAAAIIVIIIAVGLVARAKRVKVGAE